MQQMQRYFKKSKLEIANNNLSLIKATCVCGFCIICVLLIITPYLLPHWEITIGHILFPIIFLAYYIWASFVQRQKTIPYTVVQIMVLSFLCIFMGIVIYIETVPYPDSAATLVTPAMIVLPILFVMPMMETLLILFVAYLAFIGLSMVYVNADYVNGNIFNGLVGILFGFMMAWIVTNLRAKDEKVRQEIIRTSRQDKLTGVYNKSAVEQECFAYLEENPDEDCILIVMDVDSFKSVNDTLGHQAGDTVLNTLGVCLKRIFREKDISGRVGGDEFVILMKDAADPNLVEKKMEYFSKMFSQLLYQKFEKHITCSYGAIIKKQVYTSYVPLFEMADHLLYEAKESGRSRGTVKTIFEYIEAQRQKDMMEAQEEEPIERQEEIG